MDRSSTCRISIPNGACDFMDFLKTTVVWLFYLSPMALFAVGKLGEGFAIWYMIWLLGLHPNQVEIVDEES